jgi:hypothetical protein
MNYNYNYSASDYTATNGRNINELKRMWKEAAKAYFMVLSQYLPGGTQETSQF